MRTRCSAPLSLSASTACSMPLPRHSRRHSHSFPHAGRRPRFRYHPFQVRREACSNIHLCRCSCFSLSKCFFFLHHHIAWFLIDLSPRPVPDHRSSNSTYQVCTLLLCLMYLAVPEPNLSSRLFLLFKPEWNAKRMFCSPEPDLAQRVCYTNQLVYDVKYLCNHSRVIYTSPYSTKAPQQTALRTTYEYEYMPGPWDVRAGHNMV